MECFLQVIVFILGTIIGSFLNVVILRYGQKSLNGRSACPVCNKKLNWYELIPILSFIFLRGRCHKCHQRISWQYPLVEISTGLIFLLIFNFSALYWQFLIFDKPLISEFVNRILLGVIFSILIVIFVYDLYHKIIPDLLVVLFGGLSLILAIERMTVLSINWWEFSLENYLWAGPMLALPFAFLWFISKGQWIGLGDAKLSWGIGWFLGLIQGSLALILGIWLGALVGLLLIFLSKVITKKQLFLFNKTFTIKSEIPLAPFLIMGIALVFFLDWSIWDLILW